MHRRPFERVLGDEHVVFALEHVAVGRIGSKRRHRHGRADMEATRLSKRTQRLVGPGRGRRAEQHARRGDQPGGIARAPFFGICPKRAQYQSSATFASSDMRSGVHGGSKTIVDRHVGDAGHETDRVLHPARHLAGDRATRRGQRHVDVDVAVVVDVDAVDQAELVDVGRDLGVVDGLQRRNDVLRQPIQFLRRDGRAGRVRAAPTRRAGAVSGSAVAVSVVGVGLVSSMGLTRRNHGPSARPRQGDRLRRPYCRARMTRGTWPWCRSGRAAAGRSGSQPAPRRRRGR